MTDLPDTERTTHALPRGSRRRYIAVDLDGTLAEYHGWRGGAIGEPIPAMVARVRAWLAEGHAVYIYTSRIARTDEDDTALALIEEWCEEVFGVVLPVTAIKHRFFSEFWDDRAHPVSPNTGEDILFLTEELTSLLGESIHPRVRELTTRLREALALYGEKR